MQAEDDGNDLAVLICSANIGNAEPTPSSFAEWVPDDGDIDGPVSRTKYPVEQQSQDGVALIENKKKFDIIVLGMQEAAFVEKTKRKSSKLDEESDGGCDVSERADGPPKTLNEAVGATVGAVGQGLNEAVGATVGAVGQGVAEVTKQGEKNTKDVFRKVAKKHAKANLVVRGLTTSQTYKASDFEGNDSKDTVKSGTKGVVSSAVYDTSKFLELIENRCPSYVIVTAKLRGEMRLCVLVLKELAKEVTDVHIAAENTGIGSVLANKGGIIATLTLRQTRLSFMTCHLEAHEGLTHYTNRNKNLAEILGGAKTDPNYNMQDATIISHHMFVCGDLNYRIKFGEYEPANVGKKKGKNNLRKSVQKPSALKLPGIGQKQKTQKMGKQASVSFADGDPQVSSPTSPKLDDSAGDEEVRGAANGSHFVRAKALVDAEDWKTLNDGDELAMALEKKECLVGFTTLPCHFPPTFKVARCEDFEYNEKRTPSYTDRILWKSADGLADNVVPFLYEPCPDFITSDHKPIRGGYVVKTNQIPFTGRTSEIVSESRPNEPEVNLLVSDIKCTNLPVMDSGIVGGLSDPYILFVSYPKTVLWQKAWPSTKVVHRNLNPVWKEAYHLILDRDTCRDGKGNISLNGSMLYMTVLDEDLSSGDDVIGTVALNLHDLCSDLDLQGEVAPDSSMKSSNFTPTTQTTKISRPILRNGVEFGMLECTISSAYLTTSKQTKAFLKGTKQKVRSKYRHTSLSNKISKFFLG